MTGVQTLLFRSVKNRKVFKLENPCPQLLGREKAVIYLTAPITIITIIYLLASTVMNAFPHLYTTLYDNIKDIFN